MPIVLVPSVTVFLGIKVRFPLYLPAFVESDNFGLDGLLLLELRGGGGYGDESRVLDNDDVFGTDISVYNVFGV